MNDPQVCADYLTLEAGPRRSGKNPAPDVLAAAHKLYPTCGCAEAYCVAWYVPIEYMEALALVEELHQARCPKPKSHKGNGRYLGPFAFTLTASPTDGKSVGDFMKAVRKVMSQKSQPVTKFAWYLEYGSRDADGIPTHPHIHGMYETEDHKRIERKHWMRAWSIWDEETPMGAGFRGGYHRPVKSEERYSDYIAKDGGLGESSDNI